MTTVQDLPDDCLARILSRLHSKEDKDAAALTCRLWRALDAHSRHSLCFSNDKQFLHHLMQSVKTFAHIFHLKIYWCTSLLPADAFFLFLHEKGLPQLKELNVQGYFHGGTSMRTLMESLAVGCPALTHLSVWGGRILGSEGCQSLAHGCRHLLSLHLYWTYITDEGMDVILSMCPNMMEVTIHQDFMWGWGFRRGSSLKKLDVTVTLHMRGVDAGFEEGLQGASSLRILRFRFSGRDAMVAPVIGDYCKLLEELSLYRCERLDDSANEKIVEGCKELRVLEVRFCHEVTLRGWQALARSSIKLEDLDVRYCRQFCGDSLLAIQNGCPKLRSFEFDQNVLGPPNPQMIQAMKHFRVSRPHVHVTAPQCGGL